MSQIRRFLIAPGQLPADKVELPIEEARHATQVLRLRNDDIVELIDGNGSLLRGKLEITKKKTYAKNLTASSPIPTQSTQVHPIHLEISLIKNEALEWLVEKSVELGAEKISLLHTEYSTIKKVNLLKLQKIADQALKQCNRLYRMIIEEPVTLDMKLKKDPSSASIPRIWLHPEQAPLQKVLHARVSSQVKGVRLTLGPEGGWSDEEVFDHLMKDSSHGASLSPLILRAETASVCSLSIVGYHLNGNRI